MKEKSPENLESLEEQVIDQIARVLVFIAREQYQKEQKLNQKGGPSLSTTCCSLEE
jgi:hypothetical protein